MTEQANKPKKEKAPRDPNGPTRLTVTVTFEGEHADFVLEAIKKEESSNISFLFNAGLNEAGTILDRDPPKHDRPKKATFGGAKGSRNPEAAALGLSTAEYERRVKLLKQTGIPGMVTPANILLVEAPKRVVAKKPKAPIPEGTQAA